MSQIQDSNPFKKFFYFPSGGKIKHGIYTFSVIGIILFIKLTILCFAPVIPLFFPVSSVPSTNGAFKTLAWDHNSHWL